MGTDREATAKLDVETLLLVREIAGTELSIAQPVADLALASVSDDEATLALEQRVFLAEHLATIPPERASRFVLPEGVHVVTTDVTLPRDARATRLRVPISVASVVLPATDPDAPRARRTDPEAPPADDALETPAWITILPLAHTFYLEAGEGIAEMVRRETLRLVAAGEAAGEEDVLALLPLGDDVELVPVDVPLGRAGDGPRGRAAGLKKAIAVHEKRKAAVAVLESVARALHRTWAGARDTGRPYLFRERELGLLDGALGGAVRLSALVVGASREGKSALVRAWWEARAARDAEAPLLYATSGAEIIAGMSGLGQWQERVRRVMEAAETLDAVLYFDDLGDLFAERGLDGIDLASAMKPWIEDGRVRVVGELADDRVDFVERRNEGFFANLHRVRLGRIDAKKTRDILGARVKFDAARDPARPTLGPRAIDTVVDLAERYFPYQSFPGKAVGLYDDLVHARTAAASREPGAPNEISDREVFEAMSLRTGVPLALVHEDFALRVEDVERALASRVLGQAEAVARVAETLAVVKARVEAPDKPLGAFLFAGPTGVGKTELARSLAVYLFGSETRLVRLDMSEYTDPEAAARLFRGTERGDGVLTRKVREQPFAVVLLDEIEKAHPSVFDILLQVLGEGRLTDARGRTATFRSTIVVLTSNLGAEHRRSSAIGFEGAKATEAERYASAVARAFRPELVNRLDRVIGFSSLSPAESKAIVALVLDRLAARRGLSDLGVDLHVDEGARRWLEREGFSEVYGARALRRHVELHLAAPVARLLGEHGGAARGGRLEVELASAAPARSDDPSGRAVVASVDAGPFTLRLLRRTRAAESRDLRGMTAIASARRQMQEALGLHPILAARERVRTLAAALHADAEARHKRARRRATKADALGFAEIGKLQAEHQRFAALLAPLDAAYGEACDVEKSAMAALFEDARLDAIAEAASTARSKFRTALARALVADEERRDAIHLAVHEVDDGRGLELWLLPLIEHAARLGWTLDVHLPRKGDGRPDWPAERRFGPPVELRAAAERLAGRTDKHPMSALVVARGELAGVLLALEGGVHRWEDAGRDRRTARFFVDRLARRGRLSAEEWLHERVGPITGGEREQQKIAPLVRRVVAGSGWIEIGGREVRLDLRAEDYWPRFEEIALEHLLLGERDARFGRASFLAESVLEGETKAFPEVVELARSGKTIEAIRVYRERTGASLADAKDAVFAMRDAPEA